MVTRQLFWMSAALLLSQSIAQAEVTYHGLVDINPGDVNQVGLSMQENLDLAAHLDLERAISPEASAVCRETYSRLFAAPVVDIRLVFGYKNDDDSVTTVDQAIHDAVTNHLVSRCSSENVFACGFRQDNTNSEVFYKTIVTPDGNRHQVRLTSANSSYSPFDASNRGAEKVPQNAQSAHVEKIFWDGLKSADIVIYNGHSRGGGGPSFGPARLLPSHRVDYDWYRANKPGLHEMLDALSESATQGPQLIEMISCSSDQEFYENLHGAAPRAGFLFTRGQSWWQDEVSTVIGSINGLMGEVCEPSLTKLINANPDLDPSSHVTSYNLFR